MPNTLIEEQAASLVDTTKTSGDLDSSIAFFTSSRIIDFSTID
jgi:hypothetical protein